MGVLDASVLPQARHRLTCLRSRLVTAAEFAGHADGTRKVAVRMRGLPYSVTKVPSCGPCSGCRAMNSWRPAAPRSRCAAVPLPPCPNTPLPRCVCQPRMPCPPCAVHRVARRCAPAPSSQDEIRAVFKDFEFDDSDDMIVLGLRRDGRPNGDGYVVFHDEETVSSYPLAARPPPPSLPHHAGRSVPLYAGPCFAHRPPRRASSCRRRRSAAAGSSSPPSSRGKCTQTSK